MLISADSGGKQSVTCEHIEDSSEEKGAIVGWTDSFLIWSQHFLLIVECSISLVWPTTSTELQNIMFSCKYYLNWTPGILQVATNVTYIRAELEYICVDDLEALSYGYIDLATNVTYRKH